MKVNMKYKGLWVDYEDGIVGTTGFSHMALLTMGRLSAYCLLYSKGG